MTLSNKVSIVTGASRGIGFAIARALAAEGTTVFAVNRQTPTQTGISGNVIQLVADVRDRAQVQEAVRTVLERAGRIDILVNNAGVEVIKPLVDTGDDEYDKLLDTNLKGAFLFTTAVLPTMQEQHSGHLIFINSVSGLRGFADDAVYCASKHGLSGLADALDEELRSEGIRVTSIYPGATDTELSLETWAPAGDPRRPFFMKPEDVAAAVTYVASQPPRVVVRKVVLQPLIEPPYSDFLPPEQIKRLLNDG